MNAENHEFLGNWSASIRHPPALSGAYCGRFRSTPGRGPAAIPQASTKSALCRHQATREVTGQVTGQVTRQVWTKQGPSRDQVESLRKCSENAALVDLMTIAGRSNRTKFRDQVLNPLLDAGLREMTIPDKPRSSKQRYRLTEKGRRWLEEHGQ